MKNPEIQVRRRPRQSRAKLTQEALQESFVRLLHERHAHEITIREITDVAGVGLGTFYEYFSKKEDLVALTIHQHVKTNAEQLKTYAQSLMELSTKLTFECYLQQIIHFQLEQIQARQFLWAQTGMPRCTRKRVVSAIASPPSSLTICAPAASKAAALRKASCGLSWKLPKGMSATR